MRITYFIILLLGAAHLHSQIEHPKASPLANVKQDIGFTTLEVQYSRPAVKGRTIFGDLVPYGRIWRVGANASTKFTTNTAIGINGNVLQAGTYAMYAFPYEDYWEIIFHTNTNHWGDGRTAYKPEEDAFRIKVEPVSIPYTQENFLIAFDSITHNSAVMQWVWERTRVSIPIKVDTRKAMEARINRALANKPSAQTYYEAARYYQEEGIKEEIALAYLDKALELGGDTYYFHRVRSLVLAQLGRYSEAVQAAEHSLQLAADQGKDEFVRMNEKNILIWRQKTDRRN